MDTKRAEGEATVDVMWLLVHNGLVNADAPWRYPAIKSKYGREYFIVWLVFKQVLRQCNTKMNNVVLWNGCVVLLYCFGSVFEIPRVELWY